LVNKSKKSIEKQYDETNINKLFEQSIVNSNSDNTIAVSDKDKADVLQNKESLKSSTIDREANEIIKTESQATAQKAFENTLTKAEGDYQNKTIAVERIDVKRPSYQMEVEKISLSITNNVKINNENENEKLQEDKKDNNNNNSELKKDLSKSYNNINNETNGIRICPEIK